MTETYLYTRTSKQNTDYNVWMAFPECYSFSLSSIGYLWICKELDEDENIFIERITTDTEKTVIMPSDVDALGFSFTFDMDFINIFKILEKYNIPLKAKDRRENGDKKYPIIFCGGPVVTANPEPYMDIFDFIIVGDGEGINLQAVHTCREFKNKDKDTLLTALSKIEGVYVPYKHSFKNPAIKGHSKLSDCIYSSILSEDSFFKNTFIIETSRGCSNCCGFCIASYLNLPVRFVDYNTIVEKIELGLQHTNRIALLGALVSAHPRFEEICQYIYDKIQNGQEIEMSISSMRANTITPLIVKTLVAAGQKNITIAIEASTNRLRKVINKNITEEQIFNSIRVSKENGLKGIKIYAMLGLPTEREEDVKDFIRLAKDIKQEFKGFDVTFSFSTFVPKPHTPFQYVPREATKSLEKKIQYLQKEFHKIGIGAKFSSPKWDYYQTLLSRGDNTLTEYIIEVYKQGGKLGAYKSAAKKLGINTDKFVTELQNYNDTNAPWEVINIKPGKERLIKEYNRLISKG